jgi:hypothetical protein
LDGDLHPLRNANETVDAAVELNFGAFVRSRRWRTQLGELGIECVVHSLERGLATSRAEGGRS